jgi:hypothetical protein
VTETQLIQEFALQWNEAMRKPVLYPVLIPMPNEMCASNMPGITEVPVCSI